MGLDRAARDDRASYLVRDGLVLELLHFAAPRQTQPYRPRAMNEPGLTHLSVSVEDVDGDARAGRASSAARCSPRTNIGFGVFVRDPDGQLARAAADGVPGLLDSASA